MPAISPWSLDPAGPGGLDRFTAYWYATVCHAAYLPETTPRLFLYQLAGCTLLQRVLGGSQAFPWADVSFTPTGQAIVVTRGTATTLEMFLHAYSALLTSSAPWPGQVGGIWRAATTLLWSQLGPIIQAQGSTNAAWAGHSYGGAVSTLLPELALDAGVVVTDNVFSIGSPRAGNLAFALAFPYRYLRLTNHGDPVPMVPPSANSLLDRALWILAPAPLGAFWHVGTRFHLFDTGATAAPPEQSTWATAEDAMLTIARESQVWFRAHNSNEYARRLRIGIPVPWLVGSVDYPGLDVLDGYWATAAIEPAASTWFDVVDCPHQPGG